MPMSTITVAGINPALNILGNTQQFNYTQPLSVFQISNSFIPSISIPSQFNQEFRNNLLSGFRWSHITSSTDTYGSLTLQSFINAQSTGTNLLKFDSTGINIFTALNLNSLPGTSGQVLTSQGAGVVPIWTTNGSGTVTSITAGTGLSGGTITGSGTIAIANTAVTAGTYNGPFTVNTQGQLTAASNTLIGVLASLYMSGNVTTTPVVTNTPTKILGTTTSGTLVSFTMPANNRLQYGGTTTITTMISVDLDVSPTVASTLTIQIYKNGSPIAAANSNYQLTSGKPISLTVRMPVSFATSDFVEVFITSDSGIGDNLTINDMNLSVTI